jgi:hypothetical protein
MPPAAGGTKTSRKISKGIVEPAGVATLGESGVTVAIVGGALLFVHQDVVGFTEFLELLFRVRIVRILVGMEFDRELAVRTLDLLAGCVAFDAQDFVVIAFGGHFKR